MERYRIEYKEAGSWKLDEVRKEWKEAILHANILFKANSYRKLDSEVRIVDIIENKIKYLMK